jgi:hypothetical protein
MQCLDARILCALYVTEFASKQCLDSGEWYISPEFNQTWTNFSACQIFPVTIQYQVPPLIEVWELQGGMFGKIIMAPLISVSVCEYTCLCLALWKCDGLNKLNTFTTNLNYSKNKK